MTALWMAEGQEPFNQIFCLSLLAAGCSPHVSAQGLRLIVTSFVPGSGVLCEAWRHWDNGNRAPAAEPLG
jgi:hypothetical protein